MISQSQPQSSFRPARSKFWAPLLAGIWVALIGTAFFLFPMLVRPINVAGR